MLMWPYYKNVGGEDTGIWRLWGFASHGNQALAILTSFNGYLNEAVLISELGGPKCRQASLEEAKKVDRKGLKKYRKISAKEDL